MLDPARLRRFLLTALAWSILGNAAWAGEVQVSWQGSETAAGYRLYRGTSPGEYSIFTDEGNATTTVAGALDDCTTWYFAATAYNAAGESGFSPEVSTWPRAALGNAVPNSIEQGGSHQIVISGTNFRAGDEVVVAHPGVEVVGVTVDSCSQMTLTLEVAPDATTGPVSVSVTHPSGVAGEGDGMFYVTPLAVPSVVSTTPADGVTGVALDVQPTVQFTEPVTGVSAATVRLLDEQGVVVAQAAGSPGISAGATVATIVPAAALEHARTYRIHVAGGPSGVLDFEGNPMSGDYLHALGFTTLADDTAPVITELAVTEIDGTSAVIAWTTDEPSSSRVFFRKQGDSTYQIADGADEATSHSVTLTGLFPETTYDFHVASTNPGGKTGTTSPDDSFTTTESPYEYLRIEAESGVLVDPVRGASGSGAFAGSWIDTLPGSGTGTPSDPLGTATFGIWVPETGTWYLWVRVHASDDASKSWYESIDGAARQPISATVFGEWSWIAGRSYTLAAGLHTIELAGMDPQARADRVLLTGDPDFLPTEQPDVDVTPPGAADSFTAGAGAGEIELGWVHPTDGDVERIVIRYRTDGQFPTSPVDGLPLVDQSAAPGTIGQFTHSGAEPGVSYHYGAFVIDTSGNVSEAAETIGAAQEPPVPPESIAVH